jgi:hypothetical protein
MNLPQAEVAENDQHNNDGSDQPNDSVHGGYPFYLATQRRTGDAGYITFNDHVSCLPRNMHTPRGKASYFALALEIDRS